MSSQKTSLAWQRSLLSLMRTFPVDISAVKMQTWMRSKYNWASFGTCEGTENHFVESDVTYVVPVVHGHVKAVGGRLFCFWVRRSKQRLPSNDPQLRQGQDLGVGGKNENVSRDLLDCLQKVQFGLLIGQVNQLQVPFHL